MTTSTYSLPRTQALVLTSGNGSALNPLTAHRPKSAIPFGGVYRIIDYTLANCLRSKLTSVALLTPYGHHELQSYIRQTWSGPWRGVAGTEPIQCLPPAVGKQYRGSADAVYQNLDILKANKPEYVLILSGDHVYNMDYRELLAQHVEMKADVTIAAIERPVRDAAKSSVVDVDEDCRVRGFHDLPAQPGLSEIPQRALISMGVCAFRTDVLIDSLMQIGQSGSECDFALDVIPALVRSVRMYAYDFHDSINGQPRFWRDVSTIDAYYSASMDMARSNATMRGELLDGQLSSMPARKYAASVTARLRSDCEVTQTVLSPGVRLEAGARVEQCVLLPGVHVGCGAAVRRAIVEEGVHIEPGVRIGWDAEEDRKRYPVTPAGVVVVSQPSSQSRNMPVFRARGRTETVGVA